MARGEDVCDISPCFRINGGWGMARSRWELASSLSISNPADPKQVPLMKVRRSMDKTPDNKL
jgi:hypothetical protein